MFYYLSGNVTVLEPGLAVIDCNGVGYGCRVTAYTAAQLKLNQPARLYITESIREDAFDLFGFISREEQRCYEMLTTVNGVGPKAAMAILSPGPQNFTLAVMTGDEKMLTAAQGVGKKLAQRIILELKDKIGGGTAQLDFSMPVAAAPAAQGNLQLATAALQEKIDDYTDDVHYRKMVRQLRAPVPELKAFITDLAHDVQKSQFFTMDAALRARMLRELPQMFPGIVTSSALKHNVEINQVRANKGEAVLALATHLGYGAEHVMTFGDGLNDLSMIKVAGTGVVMANAEDEVKACADYITDDCDHDGVAAAIEKFCL